VEIQKVVVEQAEVEVEQVLRGVLDQQVQEEEQV
jgi:hypothetical protein